MHFEIEKKFRITNLDTLRDQLIRLGATPLAVVEQIDCYYQHPQRDFAKTDESFRMRRCGEATYLTYKGPKFDTETKSRVEEEVRLADGPQTAETCRALVGQLGFKPVAEVRKQRTAYRLRMQGRDIEAALDEVEQVGQFVEIETTVEADAADDHTVLAAKAVVAHVADLLGLKASERRSYLEMLLGDCQP